MCTVGSNQLPRHARPRASFLAGRLEVPAGRLEESYHAFLWRHKGLFFFSFKNYSLAAAVKKKNVSHLESFFFLLQKILRPVGERRQRTATNHISGCISEYISGRKSAIGKYTCVVHRSAASLNYYFKNLLVVINEDTLSLKSLCRPLLFGLLFCLFLLYSVFVSLEEAVSSSDSLLALFTSHFWKVFRCLSPRGSILGQTN